MVAEAGSGDDDVLDPDPDPVLAVVEPVGLKQRFQPVLT